MGTGRRSRTVLPEDLLRASAAASRRCANCATALAGPYCSACGQEDRDPARLPVSRLVHEWLGDVFTFDSRLWRTLVPLVRRPGLLTREYLEGRRVRYVPPLRLFIFLSLAMILLLAVTGTEFTFEMTGEDDERLLAYGAKAEPEEDGRPASAADAGDPFPDPAEINRRLIDRLPQAMLLMVPVFAFFLWLLHRRRQSRYMPHLIFALHLHAFTFLVVMAGTLVDLPFPNPVRPGNVLVVLTVVPYLYFAQRRVYGGGRWVNAARTAVLVVAQNLAFLAVMLGFLLVSVVLA